MTAFFSIWRRSLRHFFVWFQGLRTRTRYFLVKAFLVFCAINFAFFWCALVTTYPGLLRGPKASEYAVMSFPIAVLGAAFDCLSLVATLFIVRKALQSAGNKAFLAYLSVDLALAVLAGLWVLFAFIVSGWLVSHVLSVPETVAERSDLYQWRLESLMDQPLRPDNLRNLYFGVMMGASALLPTLFHLFLVCRSILRSLRKQPLSRSPQ